MVTAQATKMRMMNFLQEILNGPINMICQFGEWDHAVGMTYITIQDGE